jgi:hypothetical protein
MCEPIDLIPVDVDTTSDIYKWKHTWISTEDGVMIRDMDSDALILFIYNGTHCLNYYISYVFTDERLPVVKWILSIMTVDDGNLLVDTQSGMYHTFRIMDIIDNISGDFQMKILELMYEASIMHSFDFDHSLHAYSHHRVVDDDMIQMLYNWWYDHFGLKCNVFDPEMIARNLSNGRISILNWYLSICNDHAVPFAYRTWIPRLKQLEVFNWLYNAHIMHGIAFNYIKDLSVYDCRSYDVLLSVLDWLWLRFDTIKFNYDCTLTDHMLSESGAIKVLNWLWSRRFEIEFKYSATSFDKACTFGYIEVLNWWWDRRHDIQLKYTEDAMNNSGIGVWNWMWERRDELELKYSPQVITDSTLCQYIFYTEYNPESESLRWYVDGSMSLKIKRITWWIDRSDIIEFKYNPLMLSYLNDSPNPNEIFDWWIINMPDHPLELNAMMADNFILYCTSDEGHSRLKWFVDNIDHLIVKGDYDKIRQSLDTAIYMRSVNKN